MSVEKINSSDYLTDSQPAQITVRKIVKEFSSMLTEMREDEAERVKKNIVKMAEERREAAIKKLNPELTKIRRIMPDGSVRISFYENGKLSSEVRSRPHLMDKVKVTETKVEPDGTVTTEQRDLSQGVSAAELLMFM